jgi:hypothetical protein
MKKEKMIRIRLTTSRILFTGASQGFGDVTEVPESQAKDIIALGQAVEVPPETPITSVTPQLGEPGKAITILHGPPPVPRSQLNRRRKRKPALQAVGAGAADDFDDMGEESDDDEA